MRHVMLIITVSILYGCFGTAGEKTGLEEKELPNFTLQLSDSSTHIYTNDIPKGSPFVIMYFSPGCPFCRSQTSEIIENINQLGNIHFYFITNFPLAEMIKYSDSFNLKKYSNITIARDTSQIMIDYFNITSVPYMAIFDNDKKLKKAYTGKVYSDQIKETTQD